MPTRKSVKRNNKTKKGGFNMQYAQNWGDTVPLKKGQFIRRLDEDKAYHWPAAVARAVNRGPIADIEFALRQLEAKVDALTAKMNVSGQ